MFFTPGSALYPALNLALLLETKEHCCYKHFHSPRPSTLLTLQQQAARICSSEQRRLWRLSSSLRGPTTAMPCLHPGKTDHSEEAWRQGLPRD